MQTISTAFRIYDGMSPVFRNMTTAMNITISSMQKMHAASGNMMEVHSLNNARQALANATAQYEQMGQKIKGCTTNQESFTRSVKSGASSVDTLWNKVKGLASAYLGLNAVKSVIGLSDELTNITARIGSINDGTQTTAQLMDNIYKTALQTGTGYLDMASTVADLQSSTNGLFKSNNETITFADTLQKAFISTGRSGEEVSAVMLQLRQALGSGVLQGDEFRSIAEGAPILLQAVSQYTGIARQDLKKAASEGKITSEIVKNAILADASDINKQFNAMPMTFGRLWSNFKSMALTAFQPVLQKLNNLANNPQFVGGLAIMMQGVVQLAGVALNVFQLMAEGAAWASQNWAAVAPVIMTVVAALAIYKGYMLVSNAVGAISNGLQAVATARSAIKARATLTETAAMQTATGAQVGMNAAMLACPATWIILVILAIVAAIYIVTYAISKATGVSISATGIIVGAFATAATLLGNVFVVPVQNMFATLGNFLGNVFKNPTASIKILMADMALSVLGFIRSMAQGLQDLINHIPGVNIDLTSGLNSAYQTMQGFKTQTQKASGYTEYIKPMQYFDLSKAAGAGYSAGQKIDQKVNGIFNFKSPELSKLTDQLNGNTATNKQIATNTKATATNTSKPSEDLKYLRDLAERRAINRLTTANVSVNLGGITQHVASDMDLNGLVDHMNQQLYAAAASAAEGVHNS
ncbi:tape measure protein [Caproicibacterium sp. XB1]|uniref:tape measure protein n=1 Tax=Caproicibacterium sp. XB1 TaxID=3396405 RepID=UPI0039B6EB5F